MDSEALILRKFKFRPFTRQQKRYQKKKVKEYIQMKNDELVKFSIESLLKHQ